MTDKATDVTVAGSHDFSRLTLQANIESILRGNQDAHPNTLTRKIMEAVPLTASEQPASGEATPASGFQSEVADWILTCFGEEIAADRIERADRFIEEALELAQTIPGFTVERARALVEYVFNRPVGERGQEVGGVGVTLAALCNTYDLNIREEWERELARVWTKVDAIRAKQATKPVGSALPIALSTTSEAPEAGRLREAMSKRTFLVCVSGDGPTPYLKIDFANLTDAHVAHSELLGIMEEPTDA